MRIVAGPILIVILAVIVSGCARFGFFKRAESSALHTVGPLVGMLAPEIDGEDFTGRRLKLSDLRGKVVVVTFWFSSCPPCLKLIPHERELVERYRGQPFALVSVNADEDHEAANRIISLQRISWPNWKTKGPCDSRIRAWGVESYPAVFVLDRQGIVCYRQVTGQALENAIEILIRDGETGRRSSRATGKS